MLLSSSFRTVPLTYNEDDIQLKQKVIDLLHRIHELEEENLLLQSENHELLDLVVERQSVT